jgi:hypothetical protein
MNNTGSRYFLFDLILNFDLKKFVKEIVFESSVLAWIRSRTRIEVKCWIRIRIESIRIHNPAFYCIFSYFSTIENELV